MDYALAETHQVVTQPAGRVLLQDSRRYLGSEDWLNETIVESDIVRTIAREPDPASVAETIDQLRKLLRGVEA